MKDESVFRIEPLEDLILERLSSGRADSALMISGSFGVPESEIFDLLCELREDGKVIAFGSTANTSCLWTMRFDLGEEEVDEE